MKHRESPSAFRLTQDQVDDLDAIASALSVRAEGARVSRSHAIRIAIDRGRAVLRTELGLDVTKAKRSK